MQQIGRYRILAELGKGGMGIVWLGHDPRLDRQVAIKSILPEGQRDATALPRLLREAKAAAGLNHPSIVAIYDIVEENGMAYIVMEYVEGNHLPETTIDREQCLRVLGQCAAALDHAHQRNVVHRDIKPSNIMLNKFDEAKIADFGLAKRIGSITNLTRGYAIGTLHYMSPEQLSGQPVNGRADQYSLAVLAYRLLTGHPIFDATEELAWCYALANFKPVPASSRNPALPTATDSVLEKALAKSQEDRYETCAEFVKQLRASFAVVHAPTLRIALSSPRPGEVKRNAKDGLDYVWIPPGSFLMGASPGDEESYDDEKPAHLVTLTEGFWIGQTPVTQAAWKRVMGSNPSRFKGDDLPVESISWEEANSYCKAVRVQLATEAQWEYAARAGSVSARYGELDEIAWHNGNSSGKTHPVRMKKPNGFGLYDTLGNVCEWTSDRYEAYSADPVTDPMGPVSGALRIVRGGSWCDGSRFVRASYRVRSEPSVPYYDVGVRCVGEHIP